MCITLYLVGTTKTDDDCVCDFQSFYVLNFLQQHDVHSSVSINNCIFTRESRMLRASLPSSGRLSVCLSVRPSVTLVSCIKTVQARITKSSQWTTPKSLVYRDKISCHWVQGFPSNKGVKEGYPP